MLDYDPDDSTVQFLDSLNPRDIDALVGVVTLDVPLVVNQARQACTCDDDLKTLTDPVDLAENQDELCVPCVSRNILNGLHAVAEKG
jgi:hypothetical protein